MAHALMTTFGNTGGAVQSGFEVRHDVELAPVFIHPDHLAAGFCIDDASYSSSSSGDSASMLSYDDDDQASSGLSEAALEALALHGAASGSSAQDATQDYFAPRPPRDASLTPLDGSSTLSSAASSNAWGMSACSTAATTPTGYSPSISKAPALSRGTSYASGHSPAGNVPATFSFASFASPPAATASRPALPRAPSPTRPHPYSRSVSSGTAMLRSVSSPVETQRQLEERQRRLLAAEDAMDTRAVKMARSKSGACTPSEPRSMTASAPMSRRPSGMLVSPLNEVFGPEWGKALPPRPVDNSAPLAFPYNVARPPVSPLRNARSRSFAGLDHSYESDPADVDAAQHASALRSLRPKSRLSVCLSPLTPIQPGSDSEETPSAEGVSSAPPSAVTGSPRNRLQRGMSF